MIRKVFKLARLGFLVLLTLGAIGTGTLWVYTLADADRKPVELLTVPYFDVRIGRIGSCLVMLHHPTHDCFLCAGEHTLNSDGTETVSVTSPTVPTVIDPSFVRRLHGTLGCTRWNLHGVVESIPHPDGTKTHKTVVSARDFEPFNTMSAGLGLGKKVRMNRRRLITYEASRGLQTLMLSGGLPPFVFSAYPAFAFLRGPVRRWRRRRKGLCVKCGYDLTGNVTGTCPECGEGP